MVSIGILAGAVAASVLVNAGMVKLVSPDALLRALRELLPAASALPAAAVRLLAIVELAAGAGLLAPPTRTAAGVLAGVLGIGFAATGAAGRLAGSRAPCGCFGGHGDRPLGVVNVLIGATLVALAALTIVIAVPPAQSLDYAQWALVATALGSLLLCLWLNRRLALSLLRRVPTTEQEG
jgi:hypothetical protein